MHTPFSCFALLSCLFIQACVVVSLKSSSPLASWIQSSLYHVSDLTHARYFFLLEQPRTNDISLGPAAARDTQQHAYRLNV